MDKQGYKYFNDFETYYTFVSRGKRDIPKVVIFQEIGNDTFNLVLADYAIESDSISDTIISNNGDLPQIMATVMKIIVEFLNSKPSACVILQGNTSTKQKLYNRLITNYYQELKDIIEIKIPKGESLTEFVIGTSNEVFYIYKR